MGSGLEKKGNQVLTQRLKGLSRLLRSSFGKDNKDVKDLEVKQAGKQRVFSMTSAFLCGAVAILVNPMEGSH